MSGVVHDFDDPFESVTARAAEQQLRLKSRVVQQELEGGFHLGGVFQVVDVQHDEPGWRYDFVGFAVAEDSRWRDVIEVRPFEGLCLVFVLNGAETFGVGFRVVARQVGVELGQGDLPARDFVGDGSL